jgi:hypothetical protein
VGLPEIRMTAIPLRTRAVRNARVPRYTVACLLILCVAATDRTAGAPAARSFMGYPCRDDRCGSHKAGFDWAERQAITDPRACLARNDPAFAEGCRAFVQETITAEQAGFHWARENELADASHCAGAGPRFEAGCQAYVHALAE